MLWLIIILDLLSARMLHSCSSVVNTLILINLKLLHYDWPFSFSATFLISGAEHTLTHKVMRLVNGRGDT